MDTYSLYDLNEYIKRVIALNFQEPIWISCEIAQCKNNRGHYYLELVQQDDKDEIIAQASAVIWYKSYLFLKNKLKDVMDSLLQVGTEVKIRVKVDYNERYGIKYVIEDIDPTYTLGQLELKKQKILEQLTAENIIHLNKDLSRPRVIKRLAIISSEEAAGFADFKKKIAENTYGYTFQFGFYKAAMQGLNTEREVVTAIKSINEVAEKYDVIIIIRGGGSKLDLSFFDNYAIAKEIAFCNLPVLCGIGHDIDYSITDIVSNKSFITPTAVADFIIENNLHFESEINDMVNAAGNLAQLIVKDRFLDLQSMSVYLIEIPRQMIKEEENKFDKSMSDMKYRVASLLQLHNMNLDKMKAVIDMAHPDHIMRKGFALLMDDQGKYITASDQLKLDQSVKIQLKKGEASAKIISTN